MKKIEVILCADYDFVGDVLNERIKSYTNEKGYHVIWMNRDIEEVFWGKRIERKDKVKKAEEFLKKQLIMIPAMTNLMEKDPSKKISSSNALIVFKEILGDFTQRA